MTQVISVESKVGDGICTKPGAQVVLMIEGIKNHGLILSFVSDQLRDDEDVVSIALKKNILDFEFASPRIKDSFDIASKIVKKDGSLLEFVSKRLQDDEELRYIAKTDDRDDDDRDDDRDHDLDPW